ncbi:MULTISPECIES: TonB-dependent siderophore receptor [unclassified Sphingopyxis]|jgi:outer membrane receptor protein involved in Fe transport|uniref:TonB-dependent receptor plug domain-containing protein n=1 Tax=unclassified Sphingopyxis TaxID=2614943 RepID=UPI0006BF451B|nr:MULTISPECIES: TonB-dependent receptor [unclassified Sphingopyxis]USI77719.1 TonB-dependent receptor [Sphingopyxis sp. USTB-05]GAO79922.1 tonB-dependent receptor [Sphingopyxis sp. C-1]
MRNFERIRRPLGRTGRIGAAMTAIALVHGAPALAQEATAAPDSVEAVPVEQIVVTGSRVTRDGFEAPTPVMVLTQEDIQNTSPTNNIADFVNQLPALAGSIRPSNSRLELSNGIAGINALNLRSLGTVRTLVLIDGRRSVGSTASGVVDINTIPQSLVERVEVVTGGASAAYGSDAVAGVTNFILKKDFSGLKLSGDVGVTDEGDGFNYSASMAAGVKFADGRGRLIVAGEIAHSDGIFEVDRDWNHTGFVRIQNPAWTANSTVPRYLLRTQVGAANSTPGGLITASTGGTANRLCGTYFGQGGSINQYQFGTLTFPSPACSAVPQLTQGGDWRVNDSGRRIGLSPEEDRYGLFGRLSFEVSDGVTLFAEASYNRQKTLFNAGPNLMTGLSLNATGCGTAATAAAAPTTCNAFLYNTLGPAGLTGLTSATLATTAVDLPGRGSNNERKVQRYLIGAEGEFEAFGKSANWDVYAQYGRAELHEQLTNIQQTVKRNNALAAVFAPAGNPNNLPVGSIQCLINVNASTADDDPACRPLNLLGIGVADPAAIDYILGDPFRDQTLEQTVIGANLSLTPFATWAGDVSIAIGAEYRKEEIDGFVPAEFQPIFNPTTGASTSVWSVGNFRPSKGSYNVKEAYLETVVPLGFGLEFNGAVRGTDYSTSGYVTTWKLGATWQPIDDIRLRVTRSRDIRAPNLNELFQAGTANTSTVTNPFFPGAGPGTGTYGSSLSYLGTITGNPNLRPEKADSWNIGAVFTPRFIPGFSLSADYFDIKVKQAIDSLSADDIVNRCFEGLADFCAAITPDPANPSRVLISRQPVNFSSLVMRGVDLEAAYRMPLAGGNFTLRGLATRYIDNIVTTGVPGFVPLNSVGTLGVGTGTQSITPKWIYRFTAAYDTDDFSLTATARGVSDGRYDATGIECGTTCPISTNQFPTYEDNSIGGATYVDLNATFKFDAMSKGDAEFFVNVTNVFDSDPILLPETGLAANSTYSDLLGRSFRVGVRFKTK